MKYSVVAHFQEAGAVEFISKLTDGTIENQEPDGREIIASMERARVDADGLIRWSEVCYCATPLEHERQTVYDYYFTDLQTHEVDNHVEAEGQPFMEYLKQLANEG